MLDGGVGDGTVGVARRRSAVLRSAPMMNPRGFRNVGRQGRAVLISKDGGVTAAELDHGYWEVSAPGLTRRIRGREPALLEARELASRSEEWMRGERTGHAAAIDIIGAHGHARAASNVHDLKIASRRRDADDFDKGYYRGYQRAIESARYADPHAEAASNADLDREIGQILGSSRWW
jgi:hypothetical protein